jgi:hypothetical protein
MKKGNARRTQRKKGKKKMRNEGKTNPRSGKVRKQQKKEKNS